MTEWTGSAADAYRAWTGQQKAAVDALAKAAETLAAITEAAGLLVAGVRMLVRDGTATLVSRLIVYAAEEVASLGLATALVVEQVATLCASWAARIAKWLKDLVSSLARLRGMAGKIAELIEKIKAILGKFGRKGGKDPVRKPTGPTREELLAELAANGVKHDPDKVILIGKDGDGRSSSWRAATRTPGSSTSWSTPISSPTSAFRGLRSVNSSSRRPPPGRLLATKVKAPRGQSTN
jgi:hypothetical protein